MLNDTERQRLAKLPAVEHGPAIQAQVDRIHRAVNTGSADRDTVNDACDRIHTIIGQGKLSPVPPGAIAFGAAKPSKPLPVK